MITFLHFTDIVPATDTSFKVSMSPWTNYTFRVIARNKVGESLPSKHSTICLTPEDVPYKNPDNVEGRGTKPNNLVIYWTVSFITCIYYLGISFYKKKTLLFYSLCLKLSTMLLSSNTEFIGKRMHLGKNGKSGMKPTGD